MKKILIFLILSGIGSSSFAFLTQSSWRWRNNDGSETTATWKAAQNTTATYTTINEVIRLRLEIYNTNNNAVALEDSLQYTTTPAIKTSWKNIPADDETGPFVLAGSNGFVTQNTPTTSQITGNAYTFVPGKIMVDTAILKFVSIPVSNRSEFEWALRGTANLQKSTTYYFKQWGSSANNLPPGVTYPSLTTSSNLPILLSSFSAAKENGIVKLQWTTATEQNSDRFEVEKSKDANSWKTIATVKGNGTSNKVHNYSSYDESPLIGVNYYRLKQYDFDGNFSLSEVRTLQFDGMSAQVITVSPNPSRGAINFKLNKSMGSNVSALLIDMNGKVVYKETFNQLSANTLNKLNFKQQPAPGIYILKLQGEGLSENVKVVIE